MLVYVDDFLLMGEKKEDLETLKTLLKGRFPMKDLGPVKSYLGMELNRDRGSRTIALTQSRYISELLNKFDQAGTLPTAQTPMLENQRLKANAADATVLAMLGHGSDDAVFVS